jgi:hypothetical protein
MALSEDEDEMDFSLNDSASEADDVVDKMSGGES